MKMRKKILLSLFLVLPLIVIAGIQNIEISGDVVDPENNPVADIYVEFHNYYTDVVVARDTTDTDGLFGVSIPAGVYHITFSNIPDGYILNNSIRFEFNKTFHIIPSFVLTLPEEQ